MTKSIKLALSIVVILLSGCSSQNPDPLEKINRPIFAFNKGVDKVVIKPIAKVYDAIIPNPIQKGISNAFLNVGEFPIIINNLLQLKIGSAITDTWRLIINSTMGVGGLYDPATYFGLKRNYQDFGLTLSRWGINTAYFVIPILGPSTITDAIGLLVDYEFFMVYPYIDSKTLRYSLLGLDMIRLRVELLPTDKVVDEAFDPYVLLRDAYKQRRNYLLTQQENKNDIYNLENEVSLVN